MAPIMTENTFLYSCICLHLTGSPAYIGFSEEDTHSQNIVYHPRAEQSQ